MHDGGPGGRAPPKNRCLRGVWSYGVWRATGAPWASVKSRIISDPRLPGSHARTRAQRHPATDRLAFSVLGSTSSRYILRGWIDRIFANIQIAGPLAGARRAGLRRRRTLAFLVLVSPQSLLVSPQSLHAPLRPCAHSRSSRFSFPHRTFSFLVCRSASWPLAGVAGLPIRESGNYAPVHG